MGSFSIWHWIVVLVVIGLGFALPAWLGVKIASRAGFGPASGILLGVPIVSLVTLWVWAFRRWPALGPSKASAGAGVQG
jgi:hypothetical protein